MDLGTAIEVVVARAVLDPSMAGCRDFASVEGMTIACDPVARGVFAAACNRAAVRNCALTGRWDATREQVDAELAALGFSCGCRGGACSVPVEMPARGDDQQL